MPAVVNAKCRFIPKQCRLLLTLVFLCGLFLTAPAAHTAEATATYIIKLADAPLASYRGGVVGLAPTNPAARGQVKLDAASPASVAYLAFLQRAHDTFKTAMATALGRQVNVVFEYRHAFNGVAVVLSEVEAATVARLPGVVDVDKDFERRILTDAGPAWIGAPSIWDGSATGGLPGTRGEGVVVGVIDTGINHDHPSFADKGGDSYDHTNPRGTFYGLCDPTTGLPFCNDKLIGVWDFTGTSPEDDNQHGSHTASTAAGNVVDAKIVAPTVTLERRLSGVAPHANLITYKACIAVGCLGASLTAAIDQATADGVDVINYSIGGGPSDPWGDADSESFRGARDAGIFVAASAGNDGPKEETVGSPANAPWLLSVGASTHNRTFVNGLADMSGGSTTPPANLAGAGVTAGYGPASIVHAASYGDRLCGAPFAPGTFNGEIVICERGVNPRVEKGTNVKAGGAGGMVLVNTAAEGESTVGDAHNLPAVHLGYMDGKRLTDWVGDGGTGHTARITGSTSDTSVENGDIMAGFSSRGPNKPVPGVIKPDITAPGVDILAAVHTTNPLAGPEYGILSGTSMSSPHMAGSAALIRALHPDWTPAEVQSALMTTARTQGVRKDDGVKPADAFDMGAGRVDLTQAGRAPLTFDIPTADFVTADPAEGGDPTTLNLPSLGHADCDGVCTWTRTVKNRSGASTTWAAQTSGPRGMALSVSPSRFTLAPNATQVIEITADVRKLAVGMWVFGEVRLVPKGSAVPETHLPLAVRTAMAQPVNIETTSTTGSHVVSVTSKVAIKDLQTAVSGLTRGAVTEQVVEQDPTPTEGPYDVPLGTFFITVDVPAGSRFLASEIVDTTALDLDLFVGRDLNGDHAPQEAEELCRSASETAYESCSLASPEGGKYWILVQNWLGFGADNVKLTTAVVAGADAGNLTAAGPRSVPAGTPFDVTLSWNEPGLVAGEPWFALVELGSDKQHPNNAKALFVKLDRTE
ncbi:MAG TPA: S8 family peptidase [Herpetosiphonaceae bacterium]|nr:S8 family peptidase [Herpetosiphonaceae bacterium]